MELFRLSSSKYGRQLDGKGASKKGARWNGIGTEIIYTSSNRSLAMAEVLVHLSAAMMPAGFMMMTIFVPDTTSILEINSKNLPPDWNRWPPLTATQDIGDQFIKNNMACLLKVPSAVTPGDFNFLINPFHKEFIAVEIIEYEKFFFDNRFFKS
ncbi:MAG: RES family NAD+ phosphorylase [Saprospiraceae bacterium]